MTEQQYYSPSEKPGYCLDPFAPLHGLDEPSHELTNCLYLEARAIDENLKGDFIADLDDWVYSVKKEMLSFYRIGLIAWKIKLMKAWEKRCSSFAQFCSKFLGRSAANVNNYIRAARVVSELIAAGYAQLPQSVSQALSLYKVLYTDGSDCLCDIWGEILDKYAPEKITTEVIELETIPIEQRPAQMKQMRVPLGTWERIREAAANAGMTPNQLLDQMFSPGPEAVAEPAPEKEEVKQKQKPKPTPVQPQKPVNPVQQFIQQTEQLLSFGDRLTRQLTTPRNRQQLTVNSQLIPF